LVLNGSLHPEANTGYEDRYLLHCVFTFTMLFTSKNIYFKTSI